MDDEFIAEVARLCAAAETLRNIELACVGGIPAAGSLVAASVIVDAYHKATPLSSPIRTA